ncbi:MAG: T9SS type A sorting domain-containing protein [Prolixibacteraceae bacterium]
MKDKFIVILVFLEFFSIMAYSKSVNIQENYRNKVYAIYENKFTRVPPPLEFLSKSAKDATCDIQVQYNDFTPEAKEAFEYAVSIWETLLKSDQVIKVEAHWLELQSSDENTVLGAAGASNFYINKEGLPRNNVFYNAPLAEKLMHTGLNGKDVPDIYAYFNSKGNWYYGTDGQTPADKFDLVTVVLHELCHGLGFLGSMNITDDQKGIWSYGSHYPFVFDEFLYNGNHQQLTDVATFPNPSTELYQQFTGNDLYFDGPVLQYKTGSWAGLYAPNPFDPGSSIDHLSRIYDETDNTLMTPGIRMATSVHDPGPITLSIMEDVGWSGIKIELEPVFNSENVKDIDIVAKMVPDFDTELINPTLHYSYDQGEWQSKSLIASGAEFGFTSTIPVTKDAEISYYVSVEGKFGRTYYYPNTAPTKAAALLIGTDTIAPVIAHIPNNFFFYGEKDLILFSKVDDLLGIDTVYVEYRMNGVDKTPAGLIKINKNDYNIVLNLSALDLHVGDTLAYRIVAKDKSIAGNMASNPQSGYNEQVVTQLPDYIETYETGFETGFNEFIMNGFKLSTADGFSSPALNSEHPYENGGTDTWLDFTAQFVFPIKIHEVDHYISFDEIALIEPGDPGVDFGSDDFFDYVVVEGSKDGGVTWTPFEDGWDCRLHPEWENAYTQSLNFNNSEILSDLNLYRKHLIDLTASDAFKVGDVVLIRFRLNSDPFAAGWGWAIDNLIVQTIGLRAPTITNQNFTVYPNPIHSGEFQISGLTEKMERLRLYDFSGRLVYQQKNVDLNDKIYVPNTVRGLHILYLEGLNHVYRTKLLFQ